MTTSDVIAIADRVLHAKLSTLGLDHVEISFGLDSSEVPTLLVEAIMKPGVPPVGGSMVSALHSELSQILLSAGEERFPYLRVRYPDDEAAVEDELRNN